MSAEFRPKGLENWVYVLDESPIPVLAHTDKALRKLLGGLEDWALSDIADIIVCDPIMTVHLIRETQRVFKDKAAGTMTNVHHCVSLLGEDRVLGLVKQFKAMKGDPADAKEIAYQSAIVQSFHAAEQVLAWNKIRKQASAEKNYLAAQMLGVPTWCLWYFATKEMAIIEQLEKQERVPQEQAERAVLGCTTHEIVKALAKRWKFPEVILDALNDERLPSSRFLAKVAYRGYTDPEPKIPNKDEKGQIVKTPSFIVALAHWLAQEAAIDWYSRQTRRVLAIVAAYLEVDIDRARRIAQQAALTASRKFQFPGVEMPAARLLLPPQPNLRRRIHLNTLDKVVESLVAGKPVESQTEEKQPPELKLPMQDEETRIQLPDEMTRVEKKPVHTTGFVNAEKKKSFVNYLAILQKNPHIFASEDEALKKMIEVLHDVTTLKRVALFAFDPAKKALVGYCTRGCEEYLEFEKALIKLSPPNFFTQLIRKPQGVWVQPDKKADIAALVPGVFKQMTLADEFFAVSVFNHKAPVAVLYVDNGPDSKTGLTEIEFKVTKSIANATTKYLYRLGKKPGNS